MNPLPPMPSTGRITLALLAVAPAVMAYPWRSSRDQWVLAVAAAVVILLCARWRGMYVTTILCRRAGLLVRRGQFAGESGSATTTTALLRIGAANADSDVLPLPLVASYLERYGIRAEKIRITCRDNPADPSRHEAWVGLTISAADNLPALQARSARIPLRETAEVAARRLADHLREAGWEAGLVAPDDVPRLIPPNARETWRGMQRGASDYIAAYRVRVDDALPHTLEAIRSHPARETCTAVEIAGAPARPTIAVACAFLTDTPPGVRAPLAELAPQLGNQGPALTALNLLSTRRLDGHSDTSVDLLDRLPWPRLAAGAHRAPVRT